MLKVQFYDAEPQINITTEKAIIINFKINKSTKSITKIIIKRTSEFLIGLEKLIFLLMAKKSKQFLMEKQKI